MQVTGKGLGKTYPVLRKKNQYKPVLLDVIGVLLHNEVTSHFFKGFIFNIMVIRKRF